MRTSSEQHAAEAEAHVRIAEEHRRASAALRAAEAQACRDVAVADRDTSPFERTEDIARVDRIVEGTGDGSYLAGILVTFRPVPGLTDARLQRMIDCHLARNAALGHVVPNMPDCPLVPRGVVAHVRTNGDALAVEIRGSDLGSAREAVTRAERLVAK